MVEAVADATVGEFERLKEFGIRSQKEGDSVSFTFRGVTETVKFSASEIEEYLTRLGETHFAGAMLQQMDTLNGAISNFEDAYDSATLAVSQSGVGDIIKEGFQGATEGLNSFTSALESGQIEGYIEALGNRFEWIFELMQWGFDHLPTVILYNLTKGSDHFTDFFDFLKDAFLEFPENVKAMMQIIGVELSSLPQYALAYGQAFYNTLKAYLTRVGDHFAAIWDNIILGFGDRQGLLNDLAKADANLTASLSSNAEAKITAIESVNQARIQGITSAILEKEETLKAFSEEIKAADVLRKKYEELNNSKPTGDRLADFYTGTKDTGSGGNKDDKAALKQAERLAEQRKREFESVVKGLQTEEEALNESYIRRRDIILKNTEENSAARQDLLKRLDEEYRKDAIGDLADPVDTYSEKLDALNDYYEQRRQMILENVALTEEARTNLELELTNQRNRALKEINNEYYSQILTDTSTMFGNMADVAKGFAGEQSGIYRGLFAVSKAFALADSIMKIQQAIAAAAATPWPANIGAIASTVSLTSGVLSTIQSTNFAGAFDKGGHIPAGKFGLVGEFGPELITGPVNVTSRKETAEAFRRSQESTVADGSQSVQNNIRIINSVDPEIMADYLGSTAGERVIMNVIKRNPKVIQGLSSNRSVA